MPFPSIDAAKKAGFPTTSEDIPLTLTQINKLAAFYDAIKETGSAEKSFAVAWTQWKKFYTKKGDGWMKAEMFGAEVPASNYDAQTHVVKAIKIGTVAHNSVGDAFECTSEWMKAHAEDWTGGSLIVNHYTTSRSYGNIIASWYEDPFIAMELSDIDVETERRMMAGEHTGFSFDSVCPPGVPVDLIGTDLSILFYPHVPACKSHEGCGLTAEEPPNSQSQTVINENIKNVGSNVMAEKQYTDAEIEAIRAESANVASRLATFEAEAKTHVGELDALKADISTRDTTISELTDAKDAMFSAEDVETKVTEAKETMFSAEDVETATKTAVETALAAEAEKLDRVTAELDAVTKMFPEGLDDTFRAELVTLVKEGKSHEAIVKLGEVDYKSFKASVHTDADKDKTGETDDTFVASAGVGVYDPLTNTFSAGGV